VLVGLWLRALPLLRWPNAPCLRDECTYSMLASRLLDGDGMTVPSELRRWIWAPGYPALLSAHGWLGDVDWVRWTQVLLVIPIVLCGASLARGIGGGLAGRVTAWCLALSPTLVFFSGRLWSETVYIALLLGALVALRWAMTGPVWRNLLPGVLVAGCILLRGVAAPMLPLFALVRFWRDRSLAAAATLLLSGALTVAPYSLYASKTFEGPVLSDRTMGQMMWLGNNTFEPVSFDHGIGPLSVDAWERVVATGRPHCDGALNPTDWDDCERAAGWARVRDRPSEFLRRIPVRLGQLLNPNSFLTRSIRQEDWWGLPRWLAEGLCVTTLLWSGVAVLGGLIGVFSRGKSWFASLTVAIVGYHVVAIALVAGLSRYRVPLDVLGLIWAGVWLGQLPGTVQALGPRRAWALGLALLAALGLMARYALVGFLP
jgi:hypothetical protein